MAAVAESNVAQPAPPAQAPTVAYTAQPGDLDGRCPYRLVDPAPHHYRVQGRKFHERHPGEGVYNWPA